MKQSVDLLTSSKPLLILILEANVDGGGLTAVG